MRSTCSMTRNLLDIRTTLKGNLEDYTLTTYIVTGCAGFIGTTFVVNFL